MGETIRWDVSDSDPDAAAGGGGFESPRPGQYVFKIDDLSKKGSGGDASKPMLEVILKVEEPEKEDNARFVGSRIWYYVLLPGHPSYEGFPLQKADNFWQAVGAASKRKRKGSINTDDLLGLQVCGVVRAGKNLDGEYRGEIASLFAYDEERWSGMSKSEDEYEDLPDEEDEEEEEEAAEEEEEEEETYDDWSLADLRAELKARELSVAGGKSALVARLEEDDENAEEEEEETDFPFKK